MFKTVVGPYEVEFTFRHTRDANFEVKPGKVITDITSCLLRVNGEDFNSLAACLKEDIFSKEQGRKLSLERALHEAQLPRTVRTAVWNTYWNRGDR